MFGCFFFFAILNATICLQDNTEKQYNMYLQKYQLSDYSDFGLGNLMRATMTAEVLKGLVSDERLQAAFAIKRKQFTVLAVKSLEAIKINSLETSELDTATLNFMTEKQKLQIVDIAIATEGLYALRHPFVQDHLKLSQSQKRKFLELLAPRLDRAKKYMCDYVSVTANKSPEAIKSKKQLAAEISREFDLLIWHSVLDETNRNVLLKVATP